MKIYKLNSNKEIYENKQIVELMENTMFRPTIGRIKSASESIYSKEQGRFYVAEEDGYIGILGVKRTDNKFVDILHFAVSKNHRKSGVGSEMIKTLIAHENVEEIRADASKDNFGFFKKLGFTVKQVEDPVTGALKYQCIYKK